MKSSPDRLLKDHPQLVHSVGMKVRSHVQRQSGDWYINTLMIEGYDVPFRYQRKKEYNSLQGARVNLTYYPSRVSVAGMEMEVMKVVRVKRA